MLTISQAWKDAYPGAQLGVLVMKNVRNPDHHPVLEERKKELERDLRILFKDPGELKNLEPIKAYQSYYKKFRKTYHVYHQLESVIFKGKSIPRVAALVEAMFMAELRNMLLTAGHDMDRIQEPLRLEVAKGDEKYIKINGQEQILKPGDMMIRDSAGVISSVIYGPDKRTRIVAETSSALFYCIWGSRNRGTSTQTAP